MEVVDLIPEQNIDKTDLENLLDGLCNSLEDVSPTMLAIKNKYQTNKGKDFNYNKVEPFSSEKKYSRVICNDAIYYLGAPEFIIKDLSYDNYSNNYRTLLIAKEKDNKRIPLGIILIQDKIRKEAKDTLKYFKEQDVEIKKEKRKLISEY